MCRLAAHTIIALRECGATLARLGRCKHHIAAAALTIDGHYESAALLECGASWAGLGRYNDCQKLSWNCEGSALRERNASQAIWRKWGVFYELGQQLQMP